MKFSELLTATRTIKKRIGIFFKNSQMVDLTKLVETWAWNDHS